MKKKKSTKTNSSEHFYQEKMVAAFSRLEGVEAKYQNILAAHGRVPAAVAEELAKAEADYGYYKAMWKDSD